MRNFKKFLSKKNVFIFGFVLVLIIGGLFFWFKGEKEIKGSPDDYQIIETEQGIFVENKKAGLTVKAPKGWRSQIIEFQEVSLVIESPDIEGEQRYNITKPPFEKGCGIEINVAYEKTNFNELIKIIKEINAESFNESSEIEMTTINNRQALKNIFHSAVIGDSVTVYFVQNAKVFAFALRMASDEKERCIQEFDNFLETVSIK